MGTGETNTLEREVKFEAPVGLALPDLDIGALGGWTEHIPQQRLRTAYFDTADGRLWERGITLRHRITDNVGDGTWTLKLPHAGDGPILERTEMSRSGERATVPWDVRVIMRGVIRRETLQQLVELGTTRVRLTLHDQEGRVVGEVDDDTVTVAGGPRDGLCFRQVELELGAGETLIGREVAARLGRGGLAVENSPKFAKAMGLPTSRSTRPSTDRRSSLADVVGAAIVDGVDRLLDHDWRLRIALPEAAHDVHQARVAIRRLRSHLKTFSVVLDPVWVRQTRRDLEWAGSLLGELRDVDVLAVDLEGAPAQLSLELTRQRSAGARQVASLLGDERYLELLDRLHAAAGNPPFSNHDTLRADDLAREALPGLVAAQWRALRHQVRMGGDEPSDEQLHSIRKSARHLRFAAEVAAPVIGDSARRTAAGSQKIQTILGEHQDAVTAERWLRAQVGRAATSQHGDTLSPESWFEAGRFSAELQHRQRRLRRRWPRAWKALTRPGHRRRRW